MPNRMTTVRLNKKILPFLMAVITALSIITMNAKVTYAHHDDNELIKTVFHVYVDGEKIGTVRERHVVDQAVEEYIEKAKAEKGDFAFTVNQTIELKKEKMFRPQFDNIAAREALAKVLTVSMDAYRLTVGGKTVAYLSSEKEAEDVLLLMKLEHVSKEDLDRIEKAKSENEELAVPELKSGESQIIDVDFSEPVYVHKTKVTPNELVTTDEAINMLKEGTVQKKEHEVKKGETAESISEQYHLTMDQFYTLNPTLILTSIIREGDVVIVQERKPFTEVVVFEATRAEREIPFKTEKKEDSTLDKGVTKTIQKGQIGLEDITYTVRTANGITIQKDILSQKQVKAPVTEIQKIGTKIIPSKGTGKLAWPAVGGYISSEVGMRWGSMHKGLDIARPSNRTIKAADNGTVVFAGWDGDYGNKIIINHNNGIRTVYAHLNSISVSVGDVVQQGSKIGVMGTTGQSTGIHLHFEVYKNGALQNPRKYL